MNRCEGRTVAATGDATVGLGAAERFVIRLATPDEFAVLVADYLN
ncbi:hypothetical protein ACFWIJ_21205 [Streptomyces sp. NPDC127079]